MKKIYVVYSETTDYKDSGTFIYGAFISLDKAKEEMLRFIKEIYEGASCIDEDPDFIDNLLSDDGMSFEDDTDPSVCERVYIQEVMLMDFPDSGTDFA